jgi:hypothetical protein
VRGPLTCRLEAHASTRDFKSKWNLPVYFHLRFTEISGLIDAALRRAEAPSEAGGPKVNGNHADHDAYVQSQYASIFGDSL